ncbi:MAG: peptide-modifying radical SAM enzyme CbpB, partial [Nitrospirae bacterium]
LIDPDNVFWAIMKDDNSIEEELERKVLSLYEEKKGELDEQMRSFRFDIELSAIYINPTDRCNGRCRYCYIPEQMRVGGIDMPRSVLYKVLERTVDYFSGSKRKPVVVFHGSEPLMVKDLIFEAINDFRDEIIFGIQTNATLMEEEDASFLMDKRVSVGLSLDSLDMSNNTALRPMKGSRSSFSSVLDALNWFNGYRGLNVVTTVTNKNVHELPEIVDFLHKHNVPAALINPIRCTIKGTEVLRPDQELFYKYFKEAVDRALNLTMSSGRKIVVSSFSNTILSIVAPQARRLMCDITPCGGGRRFFYVLADSNTTPCGEFIPIGDYRGGDIREHPIEEILQSEPFKRVRSRIVEEIEECSNCIYRNICGAPCPGEIHETDGTMFAPSPYCSFYKRIIDYAFNLIANDMVDYL